MARGTRQPSLPSFAPVSGVARSVRDDRAASRTAEQPEICADNTPLTLTGAVSAHRPLCTRDAAGVTLRHCNDGRQAKTISGPLPSAVHPSATISLRIEREIMYR